MYLINERENLLDNLDMALYFMRNPIRFRYKWVTISLHQALYGALILGIQKFDGDPVVYGADAEKFKIWMEYRNGATLESLEKEHKKENIQKALYPSRLMGFDEVDKKYTNLQKSDPGSNQSHPILSEHTRFAIDRLKSIRDQFEHFAPIEFGLLYGGIHSLYFDILKVIETILMNEVTTILSPEDEQKLREIFLNLREIFSNPVVQNA